MSNAAVRFFFSGLLLILSFLMGGCAHYAPDGVLHPGAQLPAYHSNLALAGRLSVQYQLHGSNQYVTGRFNWHQTLEAVHVTLSSPFGDEFARLILDKAGAQILRSGHSTVCASSAGVLVEQVLGYPFPLEALRSWLQGRVEDSKQQIVTASPTNDHIQAANGWNLHYVNWKKVAASAQKIRPFRIDIRRDTASFGVVEIRIVIDAWDN